MDSERAQELAKQGAIISFEGPDGTGKTHLIRLLDSYFKHLGIPSREFDELGKTRRARFFRREIFPERIDRGADPSLVLGLFYQASYYMLRDRVLPFLRREGGVALIHRYVDSTYAHHHKEGGVPLETILRHNKAMRLGILPDHTVLLKFPPERFAETFKARRTYIDRQKGRAGSERDENVWDVSELETQYKRQLWWEESILEGIRRGEPRRYSAIDATLHPDDMSLEALRGIIPTLLEHESLGPRLESQDLSSPEGLEFSFLSFLETKNPGNYKEMLVGWASQQTLIQRFLEEPDPEIKEFYRMFPEARTNTEGSHNISRERSLA